MSSEEGNDQSPWMVDLRKKYNSSETQAEEVHASLPTIVRVPHIIRRTNDQAYDPHMLSIGPYHRPNHRVAAMEKQKWKYLRHFCARNSGLDLDDILRKVQEVKETARSRYLEEIPVGDEEFGELLVLDGCFIVELFLKAQDRKRHPSLGEKSLHENDLIFASSSEWILRSVARDLLLVENQLPFFVIHHIFNSFANSLTSVSLADLAVEFFKPLYHTIGKMESSRNLDANQKIKSVHLEEHSPLHLLHLIHSHFIESSDTPTNFDSSLSILPLVKEKQPFNDNLSHQALMPLQTVPSAKRLQEAGIRFQRRQTGNLLDIRFEEGLLEIPHLVVDHYTNTFLRNLIAFEQVNPAYGKCFTFYATFMDFIVNTAQDVEILLQSGIMDHGLGSDKNIASMFNMMCKGLTVESAGNDRYHKLTTEIMEYFKTPWNMWRAKLNRDYFSNPWAIISFSAGVLAIWLTLLNTFYNVYRYYHPSP
ncbi:UPF0481 protein At3g47200-like [Aristolochia californica]|uniref:UPF0481 protein At3g47200-like n=1 Tax=Aristolochia californica TaxID=171875 RepID=UPI0035DFB5B4